MSCWHRPGPSRKTRKTTGTKNMATWRSNMIQITRTVFGAGNLHPSRAISQCPQSNPARANKTRQSGRLVLRFSGNQCHLTCETFVRPWSCVVSYAETPRHLNDAAKTCKFDSSFSHGETARQRSLWQGWHLNSFDVELRKQIKGPQKWRNSLNSSRRNSSANRIKWFSDIHFTKRSKS